MAEQNPPTEVQLEKLKGRDLLASHRPKDVDPTAYAAAQGATADARTQGYEDSAMVEEIVSHGGERGLAEGVTDTGAYLLRENPGDVGSLVQKAAEREQWKREGEPGPIKKWLRGIATRNDIGWLKKLTGIKPKKKEKWHNKGGEYVRKFDL